MTATAWIAVDWGTSSLRLWAVGPDGATLAARRADRGMGMLAPDEFEEALLDLARGLLPEGPVQVVICGMAGARQGWVEAPYRPVPCAPGVRQGAVRVGTRDRRLEVTILPGLSQDAPADVMRGEETQIAGFLTEAPDFDGVLCLPGTHCKWVRVAGGRVLHFRTTMTGELFALLAGQSVLRHSTGPGAGWNDDAFHRALDAAQSHPDQFAAALFPLRAGALLHDLPQATVRARLSGTLIGADLAAIRDLWQAGAVAVIGDAGLAGLYCAALTRQGLDPLRFDAGDMALRGLSAAHASLEAAP